MNNNEGKAGSSTLPFAPFTVAKDIIFVSGQVPDDFSASIEEQTHQALVKIQKILGDEGASIHDILKVSVFIVRKSDFQGMNKAFSAFFRGHMPARSTIVTELVVDALVEVDAVAKRH